MTHFTWEYLFKLVKFKKIVLQEQIFECVYIYSPNCNKLLKQWDKSTQAHPAISAALPLQVSLLESLRMAAVSLKKGLQQIWNLDLKITVRMQTDSFQFSIVL